MTYSQSDLDELIACLKTISTPPRKEDRLVGADRRNEMKMTSAGRPGEFTAFFRRNEDFPENFSIGLCYDPKDGSGEITLLRCNGPHGLFNGSFDPSHPHWKFHIHHATAEAIERGARAERHASPTAAFGSYEEAVDHFVRGINLNETDRLRYFPDRTTQLEISFGEQVQ